MEMILDIVLIALIALMVVLGIKRGLVKTCVGLVSTILVIVIAVVAVTPLTNLVMVASDLDETLQDSLETPLANNLPNPYVKVYYYDLNPETEGKELIYEIDGDKLPFSEILAENEVLHFLNIEGMLEGTIDELLYEQAENNPDISDYTMQENTIDFIDGVTTPLVTLIFTVAMFLILLIGTRILLAIVLKLLQKIISRLYVVHFVDKMLGGIFGLVAGALFVLILLTIVQLLSELAFMESVNAFIENTIVTRFLMDNNFIYDFLIGQVNLGELMGNLGQ